MNQPGAGLSTSRSYFGRGFEIIGLEFGRAVECPSRVGDGREVYDGMRIFKQRAQISGPYVSFDESITPDRGKIEQ